MYKKSNAWFFNNSLPNFSYNLSFTLKNNNQKSDTNDKAADSLHRRCSSEQAYYEIINNNKFQLSPNKDRSSNFLVPSSGQTLSQCLGIDRTSNQDQTYNQTLEPTLQILERSMNQTILNQSLDQTINASLNEKINQTVRQNSSETLGQPLEKNLEHSTQQSILFKNKELDKSKGLKNNHQNQFHESINSSKNCNYGQLNDGNLFNAYNTGNQEQLNSINYITTSTNQTNSLNPFYSFDIYNAGSSKLNFIDNQNCSVQPSYQTNSSRTNSDAFKQISSNLANKTENLYHNDITINKTTLNVTNDNQIVSPTKNLNMTQRSISPISPVNSLIVNQTNSQATTSTQLSSKINNPLIYAPNDQLNTNYKRNIFYWSTPSSPMQETDQFRTNQQLNSNAQINRNYLFTQMSQSNQLNSNDQINQINHFNQTTQFNRFAQNTNQNYPNYSNNQFKSNNLIRSLCSPVRNNPFIDRQIRTNSTSNNLADNQIMTSSNNQQSNFGDSNYLNINKTNYKYLN